MNVSFGKAFLLVVDGILTGLFFAGIWITRKRSKDLLVICYPYYYTLVSLAPFYLTGRNIMNVYFVVLLLASVAIGHVWSRLLPGSARSS